MPELADTKVEIVVLEGQSAAIQGKGGGDEDIHTPKAAASVPMLFNTGII